MSGIVRRILPQENGFFDLFERHAAVLVCAVDELSKLLGGGPVDQCIDRIRKLETEADDIARDVLTAVRRSFITPFDRSAIAALISSLDDAVDEIWHTAKTVRIYHVAQFEPQMRSSADLAREAARLVGEAIPLLRNVGRNAGRLHQITEAIVVLERRADVLQEEGLSMLFTEHGSARPMVFFVGRELYRYIERVLDRLQDVADEIQGIVIDHA
jgi:uncharacterized protein